MVLYTVLLMNNDVHQKLFLTSAFTTLSGSMDFVPQRVIYWPSSLRHILCREVEAPQDQGVLHQEEEEDCERVQGAREDDGAEAVDGPDGAQCHHKHEGGNHKGAGKAHAQELAVIAPERKYVLLSSLGNDLFLLVGCEMYHIYEMECIYYLLKNNIYRAHHND